MSLRNYLTGENFRRIPLKKLKTGHYKLSVKINNTRGNFILDTGASTSCIGFDSIQHFSLHTEESDIKAAGAGAIDMLTKITTGNSIGIGSVTVENLDFILFDLGHVNAALEQADEEPIHGILGADLLKRLRAVIDYGRNCFYIK